MQQPRGAMADQQCECAEIEPGAENANGAHRYSRAERVSRLLQLASGSPPNVAALIARLAMLDERGAI